MTNWENEKFFITDCPGPAILGLPTCRLLKLITLNCAIEKKNNKIENINDLIELYPNNFSGIGKLPGTCHITLKDGAVPVVHPPRKYPIHLKDDIEKTLDKMESDEIIEKVTEPSDWVSVFFGF